MISFTGTVGEWGTVSYEWLRRKGGRCKRSASGRGESCNGSSGEGGFRKNPAVSSGGVLCRRPTCQSGGSLRIVLTLVGTHRGGTRRVVFKSLVSNAAYGAGAIAIKPLEQMRDLAAGAADSPSAKARSNRAALSGTASSTRLLRVDSRALRYVPSNDCWCAGSRTICCRSLLSSQIVVASLAKRKFSHAELLRRWNRSGAIST